MRERSLEAVIVSIYGAYFTGSSARQAATEGLSRQDIYFLAAYMESHKELLNGNKRQYFTNTTTYLNERYGDYHAYLLFEKLRDPKVRVFDDENDYLTQFSDLIKETRAPAALKNVLLNRLYPPHHFDQEKQKYINFIEKYKRFDCYIIATKCAEQGKVLEPNQLRYLAEHLKDMSQQSERFYDYIADQILKNGVRNTLENFDTLEASFNEQRQNRNQSVAEFDDADTIETNLPDDTHPAEAETDESVEFIDQTLSDSSQAPSPQTPPTWVRTSPRALASKQEELSAHAPPVPANTRAGKDTVPLPYLHEQVDPYHLRGNQKIDYKHKDKSIQVGENSYSLYTGGTKQGILGEGAFGVVRLAQNDRTGEWIALKVTKGKPDQNTNRLMKTEIGNLKAAKNFIFEHQDANGTISIGMKLRGGVQLHELLQKAKDPTNPARLAEAQRLLIAKQMMKSTVALHYDTNTIIATTNLQGIDKDTRKAEEKRMLHRDIKPENMIIDTALKTDHIDLGFAGKVSREQTEIVAGRRGTPGFMSPEISKKDKVRFSESSEVYALGVSMMEIFDVGYIDMMGHAHIDKSKAKRHDPALIALIGSMLDKDYLNRPTVLQVYSQLDKIIGHSNANNPSSPAGLKVYAVNIQDFEQAKREGTLNEFVQNIAKRGINSVAFYSADPNVTASVLIEAQRAFAKVGIVHIAPNLFCNQQNEVNLENIQKYYNVLLGAQATRVHTQEMPGVEISQNVQHKDIEKIIEKFVNDKGDIHFILKVEDAAKMPNRKEALAHLMDTVIEQLQRTDGGEFYNNGGKTLVDKMLKLPGIQEVIAERYPDTSQTRATLLKAGISPKLSSMMRTPLINRIENLVKQAPKEIQTQKETPAPARSSR